MKSLNKPSPFIPSTKTGPVHSTFLASSNPDHSDNMLLISCLQEFFCFKWRLSVNNRFVVFWATESNFIICLSLRLITPHGQTVEHAFIRFCRNAKGVSFAFALVRVCFCFSWIINPNCLRICIAYIHKYFFHAAKSFVEVSLQNKTKTNSRILRANLSFLLTLFGPCLLPADVKIPTWPCTSCYCWYQNVFLSLNLFPRRSLWSKFQFKHNILRKLCQSQPKTQAINILYQCA